MIQDGLLMLVIINPFAQMLYLTNLMNETSTRDFGRIYFEGSLITFVICLICAYLGDRVIFEMFGVTLPSMRVFGGLINLQLSYSYIMRGPEGIKLFKGDINELAQQIALPVMVGAGVVWVSMRMGRLYDPLVVAAIFAVVLMANFACVLGYQALFKRVRGRLELLLVKYFGVAMRFNALLVGALSVDMILGGIREFMSESR